MNPTERARGVVTSPGATTPVVVAAGILVGVTFFVSGKLQVVSGAYAPVCGVLGGLVLGVAESRSRHRPSVVWEGVLATGIAALLALVLFAGFDLGIALKHGVEPVAGVQGGLAYRADPLTRLVLYLLFEGIWIFAFSVALLLGCVVTAWLTAWSIHFARGHPAA